MRSSAVIAGALVPVALAAIAPKNFIFIMPDGMAPASSTLHRAYESMLDGDSRVATDQIPVGTVMTHSFNRLITDSAAAGTAFASGYKTGNGAIGVLPDGQPVGTIWAAAKHAGFLTGLVVTSTVNHATPASYSSHVLNRNALGAIAEQQQGYSGILGQKVDVLLGGGRCHFRPRGTSGSCHDNDVDLFAYAQEQGYFVAQNRSRFDELELGRAESHNLPWLGLFNDGDLSYEIDRQQQPERERSLAEMAEAALNALHRASHCKDKGYFVMIEASRIDHASHAHDSVAHLWDVTEYYNVVELVTSWIDQHTDTAMMSVADHETDGLILIGYGPRPLQGGRHSIDYLSSLWSRYSGSDRRAFLTSEILPAYGLEDATGSEIDRLLAGNFAGNLASIISSSTGIQWSTGGHRAVNTTLYAYAAGDMGAHLKVDLAHHWDNTGLPRYIEEALGLDMDEITALLRANGTDWIP
ncbi:hypothetical protein S7711_02828 [Stachybotrys chartarum IBT 7711]|uniref:Alkaline phosphatase n=1 Tax=Stachybotrys chartarum (strain CBS 109288 / IBT 7711) TaxID=1280523 RepID=A0A084AH45_STACB|nr:hypothetical protein S7711_02828 [Stachybotrys chartarum IBT 7711]